MPDAAIQPSFTHRLRVTRGVFDPGNPCLAELLDAPAGIAHRPRVLPIVDAGLLGAAPGLEGRVSAAVDALGERFEPRAPVAIPGGETCKSDPRVLEHLLGVMDDARLCRHSYVLAVGGGAVLDAAGFAASIIHRGVRLVRVPTTTLSQDDSGVGVKSGVNRYGKKNMLGCFAVPTGVVNDVELLETLPDRHYLAGFSEAVKVALIRDGAFFDRIEQTAGAIRSRDADIAEDVITRSAELHLRHIAEGGDPFEVSTARPLDFGHWSAHRLEQMSGFTLPHGEAVSIGLSIDTLYGAEAGLCDPAVPERTIACLRALGLPATHPLLGDAGDVLGGLEDFREHLGGRLTLSMPETIGHSREIHEVDADRMASVIASLASMPDPGENEPYASEQEAGAASPRCLTGE